MVRRGSGSAGSPDSGESGIIVNLDGPVPSDGSGRFDIGCPNILLMFISAISATGPQT